MFISLYGEMVRREGKESYSLDSCNSRKGHEKSQGLFLVYMIKMLFLYDKEEVYGVS